MAQPAGDLLCSVRAGFVAQGTSLAAWCRERGVARQYAAKILQTEAGGQAAANLRQRLLDASGIEIPSSQREVA